MIEVTTGKSLTPYCAVCDGPRPEIQVTFPEVIMINLCVSCASNLTARLVLADCLAPIVRSYLENTND